MDVAKLDTGGGGRGLADKIAAEVRELVETYSAERGPCQRYADLIRLFKNSSTPDDAIAMHLRALRHCVVELSVEHQVLVGAAIGIDWPTRDPSLVNEYHKFILNVVSAQTIYLTPCIEPIIDRMSLHNRSRDPEKREKPKRTYEPNDRLIHAQTFDRLHRLLDGIVRLVPMTSAAIVPLVHQYYPFPQSDAYVIESYATNVLRMCAYVPLRRGELLHFVVEKVLEVDLSAPRDQLKETAAEDEEEEGMEDERSDDDLFEMEDVEPEGAVASHDVALWPMRHPEGDKLDRLMVVLLTYVHDVCHDASDTLDWPATKSLYRDLLQVFDAVLLPARASGHIQFAIFYLCSFRAALAKSFLDHLWKKATDRSLPTTMRQAAVVYLSGFLARAGYLRVCGAVTQYMDLMADWVRTYIGESNKSAKPADATHHATFYAVCEALFYVFVFRHRAILARSDGRLRLKSLGLSALVNCRLNPLRWCHRTVAETFASAALATQSAFCYTVLDRNRRCLPPVELPPGRSPNNPLELYFPFDHYLLRRSERFVVGIYLEYDGPVAKDYREERDAAMEEGAEYEVGEGWEGATEGREEEDSTVDRSAERFFTNGRSPGFNLE